MMRPYQWLVLIEHNYENPVPEAGNAIFLPYPAR